MPQPTQQSPARGPSANAVLIAAFIALGVFLRFFRLDAQSLWFDEAASFLFAKAGTFHAFIEVLSHDYHPPLYFLILRGWVAAFGPSETALRSLSALISSLVLIELYFLARRTLSRRAIPLLMLLGSTSLFQIYFAQETRQYILAELLALLSMHAFLALLEKSVGEPSKRMPLLYLFSTVLLLYSHYVGTLIAALQVLYTLAALWRGNIERGSAWRLLKLELSACALFIPWLPVFLRQLSHASAALWIAKPFVTDLFTLFPVLLSCDLALKAGDFQGQVYAGLLLASLAIVFSLKREEQPLKEATAPVAFLLYWLLAPIALSFTLSYFDVIKLFQPKVLIVSAPALLVLCTLLLEGISHRTLKSAILAGLLYVSVSQYRSYYFHPQREQWRDLAAFITENAAAPECISFVSSWTSLAFDHYYRLPYRKVSVEEMAGCRSGLLIRAQSRVKLKAVLKRIKGLGQCLQWKRHWRGIGAAAIAPCGN